MASWRAPGSILEAPGLDFGGSWDEFFEILGFWAKKMRELISNLPLKLRTSSWKLQLPLHLTPTSNFNHDFPEGRVGGGAPPGGLQSAAHRMCAKRVGPEANSSKVQLQMPHLITLSPGCLYTPL